VSAKAMGAAHRGIGIGDENGCWRCACLRAYLPVLDCEVWFGSGYILGGCSVAPFSKVSKDRKGARLVLDGSRFDGMLHGMERHGTLKLPPTPPLHTAGRLLTPCWPPVAG
jgi:hypothetical protein